MNELKLNKVVYGTNTFPNVIDTEFSQLIQPPVDIVDDTITVDEFFEAYDNLFFEIPVSGEMNSHQELVKRSTEYIGVTQNSDETNVLLDEINQLRLELLEARQIIDGFNTST